MPPITINDVARLAKVSKKTVSRVLNSEPHVREAVRDRVLAAVAQLDYRPNPSARALAGSRSYLIGLYFSNPSRGYVSEIEYGAFSACRNSGYHLLVEEVVGDAAEIAAQITGLLETVRTDGVILVPPLCDHPELLAALDARRTPYVRIAPSPSETVNPAPRVFMDDWQAGYDMTTYLQSIGHTAIAFIAGPETHAAAGLRYHGYRAAMAKRDLEVRSEWVQQGDFSFRSGLDRGEVLLSGARRPTAIFASNDDMALGVMAVAHRRHLDVPRDLSIVGFDDSPSAEVVWPGLTTVRQPVAQMASVAIDMLIRLCTDRAGPVERAHRLDFDLVIRDSAGPPRPPGG